MTDAATTKAPIEPVPPVPLETAPTPEPASPTPAAAPAPPAPDEPVAASSSAEAPVERAFPKIERAIGATRQAILDHFIDSEGDQSMSQIKAALPSVLPATVEACVRREWEAGRLLRISPGVYRLAPPKPPEAPKPPPPQPEEEAMWFEALERWVVDRSWDTEKLGP